jgi:hypothetical protein
MHTVRTLPPTPPPPPPPRLWQLSFDWLVDACAMVQCASYFWRGWMKSGSAAKTWAAR